ncbi:MAG: N-acetylmuramoyl-L-alanine amidase [Cyanobacteria bacterium P01_G01_bin.49]
MRFHWLLLSILSTIIFALPAQAGRLLFWRFETNQNRLIFTTDSRVQPRAQLIPDPTRIVLDLPGVTLGRPSVTQSIGGTIQSVRVGQFNAQTARLVIELAPGYTLDPKQVKVRGISPTQWTVELPTPQRIAQPTPTPSPPPNNPGSLRPLGPTPPSSQESNDFQVTRNGLFIRLDQNGENESILVERSEDQQNIQFTLPGASLPQGLIAQVLPVNQYGVSDIKFEQSETSPSEARLTLRVAKESPGWQAYYSRLGGLVLLPRGGLSRVKDLNTPEPSSEISINPSQNQNPTISALELTSNDSQLLIRANGPIQGTGTIDRLTGVYEIRIPQAQLAEPIQGPQLGRNSPIYKLQARQEDAETVVIRVQPSLGVRFGGLSQSSQETLTLEVRSLRANTPPGNTSPSNISPSSSNPTTIPVPPPSNTTLPSTSFPASPPSGKPRGRVLVVVDPGHGGKDPGAIGIGGLQEKNVILPISIDISEILKQQGVEVMLTRNADYFVSLQGRTAIANRAGADIFVSVHANAVGGGRTNVNGMEVFYAGNRDLAEAIHRSILRTVNVGDRGVKQARFYVLRHTRMPAALVEVGFVTGAVDNPRLRDPAYRRQMAQAIAQGILDYIQQKGL